MFRFCVQLQKVFGKSLTHCRFLPYHCIDTIIPFRPKSHRVKGSPYEARSVCPQAVSRVCLCCSVGSVCCRAGVGRKRQSGWTVHKQQADHRGHCHVRKSGLQCHDRLEQHEVLLPIRQGMGLHQCSGFQCDHRDQLQLCSGCGQNGL